MSPLPRIMIAQGALQRWQWIDLLLRRDDRRHTGESLHESVHIVQLTDDRPSFIAIGPERLGRQPDGKRFRKVLIGMTLRIPDVKVAHETPAIGPRTVVLRIGIGRAAEHALPAAQPPYAIRVLNRMPGFMPQNSHAPICCSSFDLE